MSESAVPEEVLLLQPDERVGVSLALKRSCQFLAWVLVLPRVAAYRLMSRSLGRDRAFANASEGVGRVPGLRGLYLRQAFYRSTLAACGRDVYFGWLCAFSSPEAEVGEKAYIGRRVGLGRVKIGAGALLADSVQVLSGSKQHGIDSGAGYQDQPQSYRTVEVGAGAWLGAAAVVMSDVGEGAVIGAGAVVTQPIAARTVAAGVPAKVLRQLDPES